jgi:hypothetical protein
METVEMSKRPTVANPFAAARLCWLVVAVLAGACRLGGSNDPSPSPSSEPVQECRQYEAALNSCFHRDASFATQPALLPTSHEERQRIKTLCGENLRRIRTACR